MVSSGITDCTSINLNMRVQPIHTANTDLDRDFAPFATLLFDIANKCPTDIDSIIARVK